LTEGRRRGRRRVDRGRHAEQVVQRIAILRVAQRVGVVVRAARHEHEALGRGGALVQLAAQVGVDQFVVAAVNHQQRRPHARHALGGVEALRDQRPQRQPAPPQRAEECRDRGERAFHDQPGRIIDFRRQVHGDRAAERMAVHVARRVRMMAAEPAPCGAGVFARRPFGGQGRRAAAEAAVVDAQHRKPQFVQVLHALEAALQIPAGAMQVEQDRRPGAGLCQPQAVQADRRAGLVRHELDPSVALIRWLRARVVGALTVDLKDPLALL